MPFLKKVPWGTKKIVLLQMFSTLALYLRVQHKRVIELFLQLSVTLIPNGYFKHCSLKSSLGTKMVFGITFETFVFKSVSLTNNPYDKSFTYRIVLRDAQV